MNQKRLFTFLQAELPTLNQIGQRASVLTLTTLFALVPMVSGIFWFISLLPGFQDQVLLQFEQLLSYLVPEQAIAWRTRFAVWSEDVQNLKMVSVLMFFASIVFLVNRIDSALYSIFRIDQQQTRGRIRWLHYLWVMPALMSGVSLLIIIVMLLQIALGTGLLLLIPNANLTSIPIMWLLLAFSYQLASRGTVSKKANAAVAFFVTAAFYILKILFAWLYVTLPNWSLIYGMFSAIPLFLLWCQTAWSLFLYGALVLKWWSHHLS